MTALYLEMEGDLFHLSPLAVSGGRGWRLLRLQGDRKGATYDVLVRDGVTVCSCPASVFHKGTVCKHRRALAEMGLI